MIFVCTVKEEGRGCLFLEVTGLRAWAAPGLMRLCMGCGISTLVGISVIHFPQQLGAQKVLWSSQANLMESSAGKSTGPPAPVGLMVAASLYDQITAILAHHD